jgi:hypothetical protein
MQLDTGPIRVNRNTYLINLRNYYVWPVNTIQILSTTNRIEGQGTRTYSKNVCATKKKKTSRQKRERNQIHSNDPLILGATI